MNVNEIKRLIEAYYNGETTAEEERLLQNYFRGEDVAEELLAEKDLFLNLYKSEPVDIPENLGMKIKALIDELEENENSKIVLNPQQNKRSMLKWVGSIAAGIAMLVTAGLIFNKQNTTDVVTTAQTETVNKENEEKIKEAQDALMLLSSKFNKGMDQLASASANLDKTNDILNKTFNRKKDKES